MEIIRGNAYIEADFVDGDLVSGVLTLAHGLGILPDIKVLRPDGTRYEISALDILHNDALTSAAIDFGGALPYAGTWSIFYR